MAASAKKNVQHIGLRDFFFAILCCMRYHNNGHQKAGTVSYVHHSPVYKCHAFLPTPIQCESREQRFSLPSVVFHHVHRTWPIRSWCSCSMSVHKTLISKYCVECFVFFTSSVPCSAMKSYIGTYLNCMRISLSRTLAPNCCFCAQSWSPWMSHSLICIILQWWLLVCWTPLFYHVIFLSKQIQFCVWHSFVFIFV